MGGWAGKHSGLRVLILSLPFLPPPHQEPPCLSLDWKGQCLQVVPEACEQQWATLRAPQVSSDACTPSALWEKLEKVVREQVSLRGMGAGTPMSPTSPLL